MGWGFPGSRPAAVKAGIVPGQKAGRTPMDKEPGDAHRRNTAAVAAVLRHECALSRTRFIKRVLSPEL